MNYFDIFNEYNNDIKEIDLLDDFINYALDKLKLKDVMFNIIIVNNDKIHELNKTYRNIDRPTDVITFALEDNKNIDIPNLRVLGDIYISYDKVISQANEYGHSIKREICFLAIHGLLHLLGYDHMTKEDEEEMFALQEMILDEQNITR